MKLQINGFDIEINTDEANITMKVMDANGKELSNNTFTQSMEQTDDVIDVDMPETDEIADEVVEDEIADDVVEDDVVEDDVVEDDEVEDDEVEDDEVVEDEVGESFILNFEDFKKQLNK
jgi:hypothetical protein